MRSERRERVVRDFALILTGDEVKQVAGALQDWQDWGLDELPADLPDVFRGMLIELNRMIAEGEVSQ